MRKKILTLMLIAALILTTLLMPKVTNANSKTTTIKLKIGSKTVYVDGVPKKIDVAPFIDPHSNRTLVPVRFVVEGLGGEVSWHPYERFVGVRVGLRKVGLWIGKKTAKISNQLPDWEKFDTFKTVTTDQAPEIVPPGRTMIPLRFVSESVGAKVDWNGETREITITLSYNPPVLGDVLMSVPFDRNATLTSGYCMAPGSAFAVDEKDSSIFVYGEHRIKKPGYDSEHQYEWYNKYLMKYDSLTGIRIGIKKLFIHSDPEWYGTTDGGSVVDWLSYNNGYLYCATPNFHSDKGSFNKLKYSSITIKKVEPVHMSIVWSKTYKLWNLLYPDAKLYPSRGGYGYIAIDDDNRIPLKFTNDGNKMIMIFSTMVQAVFKGFTETADYQFVNALAFDTRTGNIVWKMRHDGWKTSGMDKNAVPQFNNKFYLFEYTYPSTANADLNDNQPDTYQDIEMTHLTQKLIRENHAKSNLKPPYEGKFMPERLVCVDMNTGKTVWENYFIDGTAGNIGLCLTTVPQQIFIVNGILYIMETTYDKGVAFDDADPRDENFGLELLRFDANTGEKLPLFHHPIGSQGVGAKYRPVIFDYNGQPKGVGYLAGTIRIKGDYLFNAIQNTIIYDPNRELEDTVGNDYALVRYAEIRDLPLKDPKDIGTLDTTWKRYIELYKPFTYKYYRPTAKPSVPVRNTEENKCIDDALLQEGQDSIYFFFKSIEGHNYSGDYIVYPAIVEMKAVP